MEDQKCSLKSVLNATDIRILYLALYGVQLPRSIYDFIVVNNW